MSVPDHGDGRAERLVSAGRLTIRTQRDGDTYVLSLSGELDIAGARLFDDDLARIQQSDAPQILLDLSELRFMDSTGLRVVLRAAGQDQGIGRLRVRPAPASVHRIFTLSGTEHLVPFTE